MKYDLEKANHYDKLNKLSLEDKAYIVEMYNKGHHLHTIALKARLGLGTIYNCLKNLGVYKDVSCLGIKNEPYIETEEEMLRGYVSPTFDELTKKEKRFYEIKNKRYLWNVDPTVVGKKSF